MNRTFKNSDTILTGIIYMLLKQKGEGRESWRNIWNNGWLFSKINDRHKTIDLENSANTKQNKY